MEMVIHSKSTEKYVYEPVTVLKMEDNNAIVQTRDGVVCTAIYNPWVGWMADDKYGIVNVKEELWKN